eukprot:3577883-Rhodomonas_salina.2
MCQIGLWPEAGDSARSASAAARLFCASPCLASALAGRHQASSVTVGPAGGLSCGPARIIAAFVIMIPVVPGSTL